MQKSNIMRFGKLSLAALLALQLAFAVKLYWGKQQAQREMSEPQALFELAANDIDRITINDGSSSVTLQHTDDGWQLPDDQGLPADGPRVDSLVSSVADLSPSWPVATTASSQQQLEVAADNFQRRVVLYSGEQEAGELLLGTSPGFKRTHARLSLIHI